MFTDGASCNTFAIHRLKLKHPRVLKLSNRYWMLEEFKVSEQVHFDGLILVNI